MEGLAVAPPPTLTRDCGRMAAYDDRGRTWDVPTSIASIPNNRMRRPDTAVSVCCHATR